MITVNPATMTSAGRSSALSIAVAHHTPMTIHDSTTPASVSTGSRVARASKNIPRFRSASRGSPIPQSAVCATGPAARKSSSTRLTRRRNAPLPAGRRRCTTRSACARRPGRRGRRAEHGVEDERLCGSRCGVEVPGGTRLPRRRRRRKSSDEVRRTILAGGRPAVLIASASASSAPKRRAGDAALGSSHASAGKANSSSDAVRVPRRETAPVERRRPNRDATTGASR